MEQKVFLAVAIAVLLVVLSKLKSLLSAKPKLNLPPGPWTLPVLGSIHHLVTGGPLVHCTLRDLARKHGPLMMLRLGEVPTLVVSSAEAAREVTKTHDISFADRFTTTTLSVITFDATDMVCAPYGERWRQLRKIFMIELLSVARVQSFARIREEEVALFLRSVAAAAASGAAVDMSKGIYKFINDAFMRQCIGSRCKSINDAFMDAFHMAARQTSGFSVADLFPSSRIMKMLATAPRRALECRVTMQRVLEKIMEEKNEAMDRGDEALNESLIGVLLRLQREGTAPVELTNDTIVALMFDIFSAGTDPSANLLAWCMTELIRSPRVMAKAQAEVRQAFEGKSTITEADLAKANLSYLNLVVKENMRVHLHLPFLVPRQCRETCQVMGYDIPKGTAVLINVWAICRDPRFWDDPEEFKPERFENNNVDFKGTNYEYLPFGAGRRMCPGFNLGLANMNLVLASLLYHFDWKIPNGLEPKDVDATEDVGLIANKKTNLVLHPIVRIPLAKE